jgi:hypothetical protein
MSVSDVSEFAGDGLVLETAREEEDTLAVSGQSGVVMEQRPEDQRGGFETASELRHAEEEQRSRPPPKMERPMWLGFSIWPVVVVVLIVGLAIYFLVTSL